MAGTPASGYTGGRLDKVHGRRRGRKLRPGQNALYQEGLPRYRLDIDDLVLRGPQGIFPDKTGLWLEIGFGGGEHVAWQARHNPTRGIIGCEVFQNGIVSLLGHLEDEGIENVRIVDQDAHLVLNALPDASVERAFLLFPDPWPKLRHHKRRFVSPDAMASFSRVLADGAELRLATDDPAYMRVMLNVACGHADFDWLARGPADWRTRPEDWPQTRYEAKAIREGRPPAFLRLRRKPRS